MTCALRYIDLKYLLSVNPSHHDRGYVRLMNLYRPKREEYITGIVEGTKVDDEQDDTQSIAGPSGSSKGKNAAVTTAAGLPEIR